MINDVIKKIIIKIIFVLNKIRHSNTMKHTHSMETLLCSWSHLHVWVNRSVAKDKVGLCFKTTTLNFIVDLKTGMN